MFKKCWLKLGTVPIEQCVPMRFPCCVVRRLTYKHIEMRLSPSENLTDEMKEQVEIQIKYAGYIEKQRFKLNV